MTFKFYLRMVAVAMTMLLMAPGCSESDTDDNTPPTPPDPTKPNYTFVVTVNEDTITDVAAEMNVKPSDNQATYYTGAVAKEFFDTFASDHAFLVNDIETLKNKAKADNISLTEYLNGRLTVGEMPFRLSSLLPGTEYYAYAYGITKNGEVTSELAKAAFTTAPPALPLSFEIDVTDIKIYGATVTVTPSNSTSFYFYDVFEKAEMDKYENDAEIIAELSKAEDFSSRLVKGEQSFTYSETNVPLKPKTTYCAYAFEYGNPSVTEPKITKKVFTTKSDEPFNATYESWLGKWEVKSASSYQTGEQVTFMIEINQKVAGKSYTVKNWGITPWSEELVLEAQYNATGSEKFPKGSISFGNQQSFGERDSKNPDFDIQLIHYYDNGGKPMIVTGEYNGLTGVLSWEGEAQIANFDMDVTSSTGQESTVNMNGAEFFGLNMTAGRFLTYVPLADYVANGYPIGPYTLTWKGEVEKPEPGKLEFDISITNITHNAADIMVTPRNGNTDTYYFDFAEASLLAGKSDAELFNMCKGDGFAEEYLSSGPDGFPADLIAQYLPLDPETEYTVIAFGVDFATQTMTTPTITRKNFTTTAESVNTDALQFDIAVTNITPNAADIACTPKNGNTDPYYFNFAKTSVVGSMSDAELFDALKGQDGFTAGDLSSGPDRYDAATILQYAPLAPGTDYTVYAFGVDVATQSMTTSKITRYTFKTTVPTEASDAYKAWLGTWTVTSTSSEVSNSPISFDVTIAEKAPDVSFELTGWSILSVRTVPVPVQYLGGNLVIPNETFITEIDFSGSDDGKAQIYYKSTSLITKPGQQPVYGYVGGTYNAITAKMGADKTSATATGYAGTLQGGGTFTVTGVDFVAKATDNGKTVWGNLYNPATGFTADDYPVGPFTLTKKAAGVAPMGAPAPYNLSSVLTASNYLVSTKQIAAKASLDAEKPALISNSLATTNRSDYDLQKIAKLRRPRPVFTNSLMTLGSPARYMTATGAVSSQGAKKIVPLRNTVAPIKIVNARYE